ncbi:MAG TPA: hypothetical protein VJ810_16315, partial [Blastocatellia bacterium]|nr:hypothetical protein [Blastocatellia bacterium]
MTSRDRKSKIKAGAYGLGEINATTQLNFGMRTIQIMHGGAYGVRMLGIPLANALILQRQRRGMFIE